jgi:arylsulfatase A-like enzyme
VGGSSHLSKVEPPRLFDVAADPGETRDLATKHPDKVKALEAAWRTWNAELAEPGWVPTPKKNRS